MRWTLFLEIRCCLGVLAREGAGCKTRGGIGVCEVNKAPLSWSQGTRWCSAKVSGRYIVDDIAKLQGFSVRAAREQEHRL